MPARSLIIDCDPGLDDAVAIALAASSSTLNLRAITTVAGNAGVDLTTRNATATVAALGLDVPVFSGCAQPLVLPLRTSVMLWGGTGDLGLPRRGQAGKGHAVAHLIDVLERARGSTMTICPIGPLTNIAVLFAMRPDLKPRIRELVVMGGGFGRGNATPHAELNIWVDPHAAQAVFASGVPVVLAPLDITEPLQVTKAVIAELATKDSTAARLVARLMPLAGKASHPAAIYDAAAVAYLLWPEIFKAERGTISVELADGARQGETRFTSGRLGVHWRLTGIDKSAFFARFVAALTNGR